MCQAYYTALRSHEVLAVQSWPDKQLYQQMLPKRAYIRDAMTALLEIHVPRSHTRTNLISPDHEVPRTVTLGACTQFHVGVTSSTYKYKH
eukprot:3313554-Amphidinium_carterae.1